MKYCSLFSCCVHSHTWNTFILHKWTLVQEWVWSHNQAVLQEWLGPDWDSKGYSSWSSWNLSCREQHASLPVFVFSPFTSLNVLFLYRNKISSIDANAFVWLRALKWLSLASNRLPEFPTEIFTPLESLEYLDLRFNLFHPFSPGKFSSLKSLGELYFYKNDLGILYPGTFSGLVSLKKQILAGNSL